MAVSTIQSFTRAPTPADLRVAMQTVKSPEAAVYLQKRFEDQCKMNPKLMSQLPDVVGKMSGAVNEFVQYVESKSTLASQPWAGEQVTHSPLVNLHQNLAEQAVEALGGRVETVNLNYAVDKDGHYVRAWTNGQGQLDESAARNLDSLFNAWLATKDCIVKGGYVYSADTNVKLGTEGEVKSLMNDGSLNDFMSERDIDVTLKARDYPRASAAKAPKSETPNVSL